MGGGFRQEGHCAGEVQMLESARVGNVRLWGGLGLMVLPRGGVIMRWGLQPVLGNTHSELQDHHESYPSVIVDSVPFPVP